MLIAKLRMTTFKASLLAGCLALSGIAAAQQAEDFLIQYPNIYPAFGKSLVEQYFADERALEARGPIDVKALVEGRLPKDTPGVGRSLVVTEAMVRYINGKYDPESPLFNDAKYARKLGYSDILAYPTFAAHDHTFSSFLPDGARDTLMASQLNHSVTSYRSIHPGDTLYLVRNPSSSRPAVTTTDLTPEAGSIYRHLVVRTEGSVYNQRGEKVNDVTYRIVTSLKTYRDDKRPAVEDKAATYAGAFEAPHWMSRPAHVYTDADWDTIKRLWRAEKRRGAQPLYWEDVKIGDQPTWTVDGPVEQGATPSPATGTPYGMGTGGSRTLKREILDPKIFRTMVRGEDGIWRLPNKADYFPAVPDGAAPRERPTTANIWNNEVIQDPRRIVVNFVGRDVAIRHINNWIGDQGWLYNIRWGIIPAATMAEYGKPVPENPDAERFLDRVPFLKGKEVNAHPLTNDLFIVKSYVYDKYFGDGVGYADLAWWIETIDGYIIYEGGATVRLPSRQANLALD